MPWHHHMHHVHHDIFHQTNANTIHVILAILVYHPLSSPYKTQSPGMISWCKNEDTDLAMFAFFFV